MHHFGDLGEGIILGEDREPPILFIVVVIFPGVTRVRISPSKPVGDQLPCGDQPQAIFPQLQLTS